MTSTRNPQTGYGCSGERFMFRLSSIEPHTLYLPIEMKEIPEIQQLMKGEAPTSVLNTSSMTDARKTFRNIRKLYDFDYWALKWDASIGFEPGRYLERSIEDMKDIVQWLKECKACVLFSQNGKRTHIGEIVNRLLR